MACSKIQHLGNSTVTSGGTFSIGPINGIAAGNALSVSSSWDETNGTTGSSITDDLSVAAVNCGTTDAGGFSQRSELWYYKNYGGGNRTFTLNNSPAQAGRMLSVEEVAGADKVSPLGGVAVNSGISATPTSTNISPTPTLNGIYLWGTIEANSNQPSADTGNGFAEIFNDTTTLGDTESKLQAVAAAIAATWTATSTGYQALAASFNPDVGSPGLAIPSRSLGPGRHVGSQFNQVVRSPLAYVVPDSAKTLVVPTRPLVRLGRFSFILAHRSVQGTFNPVIVVTLPPTRTLMGVGI